MQAEQVKQILESQLENCTVTTAGEGCDFQVTVVGELLKGCARLSASNWFTLA